MALNTGDIGIAMDRAQFGSEWEHFRRDHLPEPDPDFPPYTRFHDWGADLPWLDRLLARALGQSFKQEITVTPMRRKVLMSRRDGDRVLAMWTWERFGG